MDIQELEQAGVTVRTGMVVRSAEWVYLMSDDDRLVDLLARDAMTARMATMAADTAATDTAARWAASRAVQSARKTVAEWNAYAAEIDAAMPVHGPVVPVAFFAPDLDQAGTATAAQVMAATTDPMGRADWSLRLEHAGTGILRANGLPATRPDVWSRRHGQHVTRPDRVAFRGVARYVIPQPVRYGRSGREDAVTYRPPVVLHHHVVSDVPAWQLFTRADLLTTSRRPVGPMVATVTDDRDNTGRLVGRRVTWERAKVRDDGRRHGWRGHTHTTWTVAVRGDGYARAAARAERATAGAIGKRGAARGPWSLAARSLPRAMARDTVAADRARTLESILRTAASDAVLTFGTVTVTVVGNAEAIAHDGRAWPVREWTQRAALAGVNPATI
jgi:hypothetical protein